MADLFHLYEEELQTRTTAEQVHVQKELSKTILHEAANRLQQENVDAYDIQRGLRLFGQTMLRMDKADVESALKEILPQATSPLSLGGMQRGGTEAIQNVCHDVCNVHAKELEAAYEEADHKALSKLMDDGYLQRDIYDAWQDNHPFARLVNDPVAKNGYEDRVRRDIADERELRVQKEKLQAEETLKAFQQQNEHKFAGQQDGFMLYHDGEAALHLLQDHSFLPDTVRTVLRESEPRFQQREDYLDKLMERSGEVWRRYRDIENAPDLDDASSPSEVYCSMAHDYMERNHLKQLSYVDDRKFIKDMRDYGFPDKYLSQVLENASPVVREPGRDMRQYISVVLTKDAELDAIIEKTITEKDFVKASDTYRAVVGRYDKDMRQKGYINGIGETNMRTYFDCLAARELLKLHYGDKEIQEAIRQNSPDDVHHHDNYASWTLSRAKKLIKKEQNLLKTIAKKLPSKDTCKTFAEVAALGFTAYNIYQAVLHEKLLLNPTFASHLFAPNIDRETVETCFVKYPDFDREAMAGVLKEYSPRAQLLDLTGLPEERNYADNVIQNVQREMDEQKGIVREEENLLFDFNRRRGLAYQGIQAQDADPSYQFGRSALQMRLQGKDELTVRNLMLQSITPDMLISKPPAVFVDNILEKTEDVYQRLMAVKAWDADKAAAKDENELDQAKKSYMDAIHAKYEQHHAIRPSMDIEILRQMMASQKFELDEVLSAIRACSPIAIEPGRDDTYISRYLKGFALAAQNNKDAVRKKDPLEEQRKAAQEQKEKDEQEKKEREEAEERRTAVDKQAAEKKVPAFQPSRDDIMDDRDRLRAEKWNPRENPEKTAAEEYEYQRDAMKERHPFLPYNTQMDIIIAGTMIMEGFLLADITDALNQYSPCRETQERYGQRVAARAENEFQRDYSKQDFADGSSREVEHVRTRTHADGMVTMTDTTTTTDTVVV